MADGSSHGNEFASRPISAAQGAVDSERTIDHVTLLDMEGMTSWQITHYMLSYTWPAAPTVSWTDTRSTLKTGANGCRNATSVKRTQWLCVRNPNRTREYNFTKLEDDCSGHLLYSGGMPSRSSSWIPAHVLVSPLGWLPDPFTT